MAKTCMTEREIKRRATVSKFAVKRAALEAAMNDVTATAERFRSAHEISSLAT